MLSPRRHFRCRHFASFRRFDYLLLSPLITIFASESEVRCCLLIFHAAAAMISSPPLSRLFSLFAFIDAPFSFSTPPPCEKSSPLCYASYAPARGAIAPRAA
jgi:hypothetical protein